LQLGIHFSPRLPAFVGSLDLCPSYPEPAKIKKFRVTEGTVEIVCADRTFRSVMAVETTTTGCIFINAVPI